jgi:large subunit ribosomal protein L20
MTRVKRGTVAHKRHTRLLKKAKGFWGQRKNVYRRAAETLVRAGAFAYTGRKLEKRSMRALFITRINAAVERYQLSYNEFMHRLKIAGVQLNRKMLSQIAILDQGAFETLVHITTPQNS